jgi:hypothetical protein
MGLMVFLYGSVFMRKIIIVTICFAVFSVFGGLCLAGMRWFDGRKIPEVPLEVTFEKVSGKKNEAVRLVVKNIGNEDLYEVSVLGMNQDCKSMQISRCEILRPGEVIRLGGRDGWLYGAELSVEVCARNYRKRTLNI